MLKIIPSSWVWWTQQHKNFNSAETHTGISLREKVQTEEVSVLPWASSGHPLATQGKQAKEVNFY